MAQFRLYQTTQRTLPILVPAHLAVAAVSKAQNRGVPAIKWPRKDLYSVTTLPSAFFCETAAPCWAEPRDRTPTERNFLAQHDAEGNQRKKKQNKYDRLLQMVNGERILFFDRVMVGNR
jgi:hypothetical protein